MPVAPAIALLLSLSGAAAALPLHSEFLFREPAVLKEQATTDGSVALKLLLNASGESIPRSTHPRLYWQNLNAQIAALQNRAEIADKLRYTRLLAHRHSISANPADLASAIALLEDLRQQADPQIRPELLRQLSLLHLRRHDFEHVRQLIALLQQSGSDVKDLQTRLAVAVAASYPDGHAGTSAGREGIFRLGLEANRLVDAGRYEASLKRYQQAETSYRDTAPLPLAWLDLQRSVTHLRLDRQDRALQYALKAYQRLPQYRAAAQQAALCLQLTGRPASALALLRDSGLQDDPYGQWLSAKAHSALASPLLSEQATQTALKSLRQAMTEQPALHWQHGAEILLETGDIDTALRWAQKNAAQRQDFNALLLLARAERAAENNTAACKAWNALRQRWPRAPEIEAAAHHFFQCPAPRHWLLEKLWPVATQR